jgi:hypothetical protein
MAHVIRMIDTTQIPLSYKVHTLQLPTIPTTLYGLIHL